MPTPEAPFPKIEIDYLSTLPLIAMAMRDIGIIAALIGAAFGLLLAVLRIQKDPKISSGGITGLIMAVFGCIFYQEKVVFTFQQALILTLAAFALWIIIFTLYAIIPPRKIKRRKKQPAE